MRKRIAEAGNGLINRVILVSIHDCMTNDPWQKHRLRLVVADWWKTYEMLCLACTLSSQGKVMARCAGVSLTVASTLQGHRMPIAASTLEDTVSERRRASRPAISAERGVS